MIRSAGPARLAAPLDPRSPRSHDFRGSDPLPSNLEPGMVPNHCSLLGPSHDGKSPRGSCRLGQFPGINSLASPWEAQELPTLLAAGLGRLPVARHAIGLLSHGFTRRRALGLASAVPGGDQPAPTAGECNAHAT